MRLAAIDCGTNTVLLTVAEPKEGVLTPIDERAEITRLGEGLAQTGALSPTAIERTLAVFEGYADAIASHHCTRVLAVGTEALRRASNGREVVTKIDAILAKVGATLEIIAGPREAELSYGAVRGSFPDLVGTRTIVDIGGGSTELVVGDERVEGVVSLPIGSVVLTEQYAPSDPPTQAEKDALVVAIDRALEGAPELRGTIVGIAGTVTTFAAIVLGMSDYDATRVHGLVLQKADLDRELARIGDMPVADRRRTPGIHPKRADVIYAGGVILSRVLARAGATECVVSDRGVRWGLLYEAGKSG